MLSSLFPFIYGVAVILLLWQAFRVMGSGFQGAPTFRKSSSNAKKIDEDRTGKLTIHPELLDQEGRITDEELLTVRFSEDCDPPQSAETSAE